MGIFSDLEDGLEKYIEGFFRGKFKGKVQPVDIAKRLVREMVRQRRVSVNLVYVPNNYKVYLSEEDWEIINIIASNLEKELGQFLIEKAKEKGLTLVSDPIISLCGDEKLPMGQLKIVSKFLKEGENDNLTFKRIEEVKTGNTLPFKPIKEEDYPLDDSTILIHKSEANKQYFLLVQEKAGQNLIKLSKASLIVGRWEGSDILLMDESVSRRHARLEKLDGFWQVVDLDSTNGTFVNGFKVGSQKIGAGDKIKFGSVVCQLKVE